MSRLILPCSLVMYVIRMHLLLGYQWQVTTEYSILTMHAVCIDDPKINLQLLGYC